MEVKSLSPRPSVFDYDNYREFLRDIYQHFKQTTSHFSYRYFAMRAGFSSPNFLKLVIEGKRNLSQESATKFSYALKLNKSEADFFENLVRFCQSKLPSERVMSAREMLKSRTFKKVHPIRQAELKYYAKWFYIPIRELVGTRGFKEDPTWIAAQFRIQISIEEVRQALIDLEALGLIARDGAGRLNQTHKNISAEDDMICSLVAQYHRDMIQMAKESIDLIHHLEREISGTCIVCTAETVDRIKKMIREFRKEILSVADDAADGALVYQMNFQLFPLIGHLRPKDGAK